METESRNLIIVQNYTILKNSKKFLYENRNIGKFYRFVEYLNFISVFIEIFVFIIIIFVRARKYIYKFGLAFVVGIKKDFRYYQDIQYNFCDDFHHLYNKNIEEQLILYNISLNYTIFEMFEYKSCSKLNNKYKFNKSNKQELAMHMLNAIKIYEAKYNSHSKNSLIIDFASNRGWYTNFFGVFNYNILSFEPFPDNNYILKKNFCRRNKKSFERKSKTIIANEIIFPKETICNCYQSLKNTSEKLILCDKYRFKSLPKDFIKIVSINTIKWSVFDSFIKNKRTVLLIYELKYEYELELDNAKYLILNYNIPYIFVEFTSFILSHFKDKLFSFFLFFIRNGYKINLNGFFFDEFVNIDYVKNNIIL